MKFTYKINSKEVQTMINMMINFGYVLSQSDYILCTEVWPKIIARYLNVSFTNKKVSFSKMECLSLQIMLEKSSLHKDLSIMIPLKLAIDHHLSQIYEEYMRKKITNF